MSEIINKNTIKMLQELLEEGFIEVLDAFLADTPKRLQEASDAAQLGDMVALERAAHAIKGSSANIGANAICEQATRVVEGCRHGQLTNAQVEIKALVDAFNLTKPHLLALK